MKPAEVAGQSAQKVKTADQKDRITRRGFLELGSAALATVGLLGEAKAARAAPAPNSDPVPTTGKIALEEHFALPETVDASYATSLRDLPTPELRLKILDVGSERIAEMDRGGLEICILSLVSPGVQVIPSVFQAIALSRERTIISPNTSQGIPSV
jgi:hypothetical protein